MSKACILDLVFLLGIGLSSSVYTSGGIKEKKISRASSSIQWNVMFTSNPSPHLSRRTVSGF